ncbi:MAG: hypothetical protein WA139_04425 [Candidatus Aenigmatarchaeota archaeon]
MADICAYEPYKNRCAEKGAFLCRRRKKICSMEQLQCCLLIKNSDG